jgi:predicted dienelactone hydrolase
MDKTGGPYPLVVFSHGLWSYRYANAYYTEHLASYGFVVAAVDHTDNTWLNNNGPSWQAFFIQRPKDITRVIDYAESLTAKDGALEGLIDTGKTAVTGHSFGGYTSLAAAPGAQINLRPVWEFCKSQDVLNLCKQPPSQDELLKLAGLSKVPDGLWPSFGDSRVKAIIPLAPNAVTLTFGQDGLKAVQVPVLLMGSTGDTYVGTDYFAAYNTVGSSEKVMAAFQNGDHFLFNDNCKATPWLLSPPYNLGWLCSDAVWDMDRAHDLIDHFTTAFLLDVLKGDKDAHKALLPEAVKFVGIEYKTTLK